MAEERKFARFRPTAEPERIVYTVPEDGMCISTFLVIRPPGHPEQALLGRIDPNGPWARIGAMDASRAQQWSAGWMLPSSQLLYYESPEESARRIAREQLGIELATLPPPLLMSDSDHRPNAAPGDLHWDIGFVYVLEGRSGTPPTHAAWTALQFVDVSKTRRKDFVRAHQDVLRLAGLSTAD